MLNRENKISGWVMRDEGHNLWITEKSATQSVVVPSYELRQAGITVADFQRGSANSEYVDYQAIHIVGSWTRQTKLTFVSIFML
jgi:hypothetical protein